MPIYAYAAIDPETRKIVKGKLEAADLRAAKEVLRAQGQIPTTLQEEVDVNLLNKIPMVGTLLAPKAGLKDITVMVQQMSTLLDAGIPLIESLFLLEQQSKSNRLKEILRKARNDIVSGDSLSTALARYPREFSRLFVNMIRAGEVSGELDKICNRLTSLMEKQLELDGKIKGALFMPLITLVVIFGVIILLLVMVVPQFQILFSGMGKELPLPTQLLVQASNFVKAAWHVGIVAIVSGIVWFNMFRKGAGKPIIDAWLLTIPLIGNLLNKVYCSSFIRTLATLLGAGVSLTEAISTASATVDNFVMITALESVRDSILLGGSLSKPMENSKLFPYMVVKMTAIGEETGQMEAMLNKAANYLDQETDAAVATLTKMIEPIMIFTLGGILLFVMLALYLPLWSVMDAH